MDLHSYSVGIAEIASSVLAVALSVQAGVCDDRCVGGSRSVDKAKGLLEDVYLRQGWRGKALPTPLSEDADTIRSNILLSIEG